MRYLCLLAVLTAAFGADLKRPPRTVLRVTTLEQDGPLDKAAFAASLDGSPARVLQVRGPKDDLVLLVVLDLTGEVALIDAAREEMGKLLPGLAGNAWVAVLKAQDGLQVLADPTPDRGKVMEAMRAYPATGKAGLLDTVEGAARLGDQMLNRTNVRVAVLYVTDSNIYNYREDFTNPVINASDSRDLSRRFPEQLIREKISKLSDALSASETPIFFVHLNYFSDPINEAYQRGLLQLAGESGGAGAFCRSPGEIPTAVGRMLEAAVNHWSIAVEMRRVNSRTVNIGLANGERDVPHRARFLLRK